jgi:hypothetical protein
VTRGTIAGQIKALSMIVAIEGLIPDRRLSPSAPQPAAPPIQADIYESQWRRKQQHQAAGEEPADTVAAAEAQPAAPQVSDPQPAPNPVLKPATDAPPPPPHRNYDRDLDRNRPSQADPLIPQAMNRVPLAEDSGFHALLDNTSSPRQPFSIRKGPFRRRR